MMPDYLTNFTPYNATSAAEEIPALGTVAELFIENPDTLITTWTEFSQVVSIYVFISMTIGMIAGWMLKRWIDGFAEK